jgi:hypothetical protein
MESSAALAHFSGRSRVPVRRVRGDLLVARGDVADAAAAERVEHADHGVARESEHHFHAEPLQVLGKKISGETCLARRGQRLRNDVDG